MASITFTVVDETTVNPVPAGLTANAYAHGYQQVPANLISSGHTQVGGTVALALAYSTEYDLSFVGVQAPHGTFTVTTVASGSAQSLTIAPYASPVLSQAGLANAQAAMWIRGAWGDAARALGGVAYNLALGLASVLAGLYQQTQSVFLAERLPTASGTEIDTWVADFFGGNLPRNSGETDAAYISRAQSLLGAKQGTRAGMQTVASNYGTATIAEPWQAAVTGSYDEPTLAYDTSGSYGSQQPNVSVFIVGSFTSAQAQQANLAVLGAKAAGVQLTAFQVVGSTATPLG